MEQLVILLLIALISIINWIIQKSKESREKRKLEKRADATGEPVAKHEPAPDATGTETAMRRLREALGLPEDAAPPAIPKRAESERVESKRIEPKRIERPAVAPQPSPDRLVPPPLPQREKRPILVPTRLPNLSSPRKPHNLSAFANFSIRRAVCAMRLSFRRFWVRQRACESVRFPHE